MLNKDTYSKQEVIALLSEQQDRHLRHILLLEDDMNQAIRNFTSLIDRMEKTTGSKLRSIKNNNQTNYLN